MLKFPKGDQGGQKRLVKVVEKVLKNPRDIDFNLLCRLLRGFGYAQRQSGGGGSHFVFRKPGLNPITVPRHKPVKTVYVKHIIRLLDLEAWYEENR